MISAHQTGLPTEAQEPVSILIVDDELGMRETLVEIIRMMGYHADTAQSGREAEEKFAANSYNLALLDIHLPDTSGLELLGRLKHLDTRNGADTLYIIATGFPGTRTAIEALNQGAYAYITKPLDLAEINAIFARAIDRQRLERENKRLLVQLTALSELTDTALSTLNLEALLDRLLRAVTDHLDVDAGAILLLDEHNRLRLRSAIGLEPHHPRDAGIRLGEGFVGQIAAERRPLVMHAPELWEQSESVDFRARRIQSALGVPLLSHGQLIGV